MSLEFLSLENIQEIAHEYGYWAVFFGIALENTGIPLPGETITIIGGFLAGSGELNYWIVLVTAISGAVVGDNFGYWIGKIGGYPFLQRLARFFRLNENQLEKARDKFRENAPKAVFFGRFITLLRIFAGPMAGISEMPYPQFLLCNFAGAAIWALVMVTLSFILGNVVSLQDLVGLVGKFGLIALFAVIVWIIFPIWLESRKSKLEVED